MVGKKLRVLMVGGRDHTFERLTEMDIEYVAFQYPELVTPHLLEHAEQLHVGDYENVNYVLDLARIMHAYQPFDAVLSFAEYGFLPAAKVAQALGLTSNCDLKAVTLSRDKYAMRLRMDEVGLLNIPYRVMENVEELSDFVDRYGSCVVKPSGGGGSEGVTFVDSGSDYEAALSRASKVGRSPILAERFIRGEEYSVETLSRNGYHEVAAITGKLTTNAPYFVECGHVQPALLPDEVEVKIGQTVSKLLAAIGYQTGPAHTEVKVDGGDVYIIEVQIRNGGDQVWELTLNTTGIDLFKETFAAMFSLPAPSRQSRCDAQAIVFLTPSDLTINAIKGVSEAERSEGVCRVNVSAKVGQTFQKTDHSSARAGYVLANGIDAQNALRNAQRALDKIEIV